MVAEHKSPIQTKKFVFQLRRIARDFDISLDLDLKLPIKNLLQLLWDRIKKNLEDKKEDVRYSRNKQALLRMSEEEALQHIEIILNSNRIAIREADMQESISDVLFYHTVPAEPLILCELALHPPEKFLKQKFDEICNLAKAFKAAMADPTQRQQNHQEVAKELAILITDYRNFEMEKPRAEEGELGQIEEIEVLIAEYWQNIASASINTAFDAEYNAPPIDHIAPIGVLAQAPPSSGATPKLPPKTRNLASSASSTPYTSASNKEEKKLAVVTGQPAAEPTAAPSVPAHINTPPGGPALLPAGSVAHKTSTNNVSGRPSSLSDTGATNNVRNIIQKWEAQGVIQATNSATTSAPRGPAKSTSALPISTTLNQTLLRPPGAAPLIGAKKPASGITSAPSKK